MKTWVTLDQQCKELGQHGFSVKSWAGIGLVSQCVKSLVSIVSGVWAPRFGVKVLGAGSKAVPGQV